MLVNGRKSHENLVLPLCRHLPDEFSYTPYLMMYLRYLKETQCVNRRQDQLGYPIETKEWYS
jgi:hypothetical protein